MNELSKNEVTQVSGGHPVIWGTAGVLYIVGTIAEGWNEAHHEHS